MAFRNWASPEDDTGKITMPDSLALRTFWDTYVYVGQASILVHLSGNVRPPNFPTSNLATATEVGEFALFGSSGRHTLRVERIAEEGFVLRSGDFYVAAGREGVFHLEREPLKRAELILSPFRKSGASPLQSVRLRPGDNIPRTIHQTYDEPLPSVVSANVESLKASNPGWSLRLWSDKDRLDFIYDAYGWDVLKAYLKINPRYGAARADLFRYLCIYKLGGIYLDIKSGASAPLDGLVQPGDRCLLAQWSGYALERYQKFGQHPELSHIPGGEFQIWHVIAAPGHPIQEQAIDDVLANIHNYHEALDGVGRLATLRATGPIAYTLAAWKRLPASPHRFFDPEKAGLLAFGLDQHRLLFSRHYGRQTTPLIL